MGLRGNQEEAVLPGPPSPIRSAGEANEGRGCHQSQEDRNKPEEEGGTVVQRESRPGDPDPSDPAGAPPSGCPGDGSSFPLLSVPGNVSAREDARDETGVIHHHERCDQDGEAYLQDEPDEEPSGNPRRRSVAGPA